MDLWGTETYCPDSMIGSMTNIRLPTTDFDEANALQARLYETRGMYMVVVRVDGQPWTRLSAQVNC